MGWGISFPRGASTLPSASMITTVPRSPLKVQRRSLNTRNPSRLRPDLLGFAPSSPWMVPFHNMSTQGHNMKDPSAVYAAGKAALHRPGRNTKSNLDMFAPCYQLRDPLAWDRPGDCRTRLHSVSRKTQARSLSRAPPVAKSRLRSAPGSGSWSPRSSFAANEPRQRLDLWDGGAK